LSNASSAISPFGLVLPLVESFGLGLVVDFVWRLVSVRDVPLDRATYHCSCVNTGLGRTTFPVSKNCPCDFSIVMAKGLMMGYWNRANEVRF
jgi:hypothetical protein